MATIYSSDIDKGHKQVKMSIAAKNTHNRTSNSFFTKSKAAMSESLKRDLACPLNSLKPLLPTTKKPYPTPKIQKIAKTTPLCENFAKTQPEILKKIGKKSSSEKISRKIRLNIFAKTRMPALFL